MKNLLREGLQKYFNPNQMALLASAHVGIAGLGGLGSNTAMLLARCGVENMLLVDDDVVDATNLNRQHYWPCQIGQMKVEAISQSLKELNPDIVLKLLPLHLTKDNLSAILPQCTFWVEALDLAENKSMFVKEALSVGCQIVAASGLCGIGGEPMQKRKMGQLLLVGDYKTGLGSAPPFAPRVTQAAALMADGILEMILGNI